MNNKYTVTVVNGPGSYMGDDIYTNTYEEALKIANDEYGEEGTVYVDLVENPQVKETRTYQIIYDEKLLREFIDWLPDCEEHEQYYLTLFARKKYVQGLPWIKSDKGQLARKTSKKEYIFDKIAQMECKYGAYRLNDMPVPQESLATYITVSPRDLWRSTVRSIGQLAKVLECNGKNSNPHQEVMSEIQKSIGNRKYVSFDVDEKNDDNLKRIIELCDGYCDITETRGGYHVFVHKDKISLITNKMWYTEIVKFAEQSGDLMTVPWGTIQGGWEVKPIYRIGDKL